MKKLTSEDPETKSVDLVTQNVNEVKRLFPEAVVEGKIDFEVLKQLLGDEVEDREEKFGLNWHGKRHARRLALIPSTGTLLPCREDSIDWAGTKHLMIEGDNLEVLKLLQKSYGGQISLIYIDPPYNTGNDFVYRDTFRDSINTYLAVTGQSHAGDRVSTNTETSGRFHTTWLNMMYPRLMLARTLLRDDGVLFVSIDHRECGHLQTILSELFGEDNFRAKISWQKRYTRSNNTTDFTTVVEYLLVYSKSETFRVNLLSRTQEADARYSNPDRDPRGPWKGASFLNPATPQQRPNLAYPIRNPNTGEIATPTTNAWRRSREEFERLQREERLYWGARGDQPVPVIKMFLGEARDITPINLWEHSFAGHTDEGSGELKDLLGEKVFDNPKPVRLLKRILEHATGKDGIVLDFFAGSGTTGHAVMAKNAEDGGTRRYILIQLPEPIRPDDKAQEATARFCDRLGKPRSIVEVTKERLRRAGESVLSKAPIFSGDVGFRVFKLAESNLEFWEGDREQSPAGLLAGVRNLRADRNEEQMFYELILRNGLDISSDSEVLNIAGYDVRMVGGGILFACLVPAIRSNDIEKLAEGIAEWWTTLAPVGQPVIYFADNAFADDVSKLNMTAILQQAGIAVVRSI